MIHQRLDEVATPTHNRIEVVSSFLEEVFEYTKVNGWIGSYIDNSSAMSTIHTPVKEHLSPSWEHHYPNPD